jgi:hypothetical protein
MRPAASVQPRLLSSRKATISCRQDLHVLRTVDVSPARLVQSIRVMVDAPSRTSSALPRGCVLADDGF